MSSRLNFFLIFIGLMVGAFAGWRVYQEMSRLEVGLSGVDYLILSRSAEDMGVGDALSTSDLSKISVPIVDDTDGLVGFGLRDTPENRDWIDNRKICQPLRAGQLVALSMFECQSDLRFDRLISPGMRAFTLRVNEANSVNNRVIPGSRIDIMGVTSVSGGQSQPQAEILLGDAKVLAVGRATTVEEYRAQSNKRYRTITIETRPEEASALTFKLTFLRGEIQITMRNPCDSEDPSPVCTK